MSRDIKIPQGAAAILEHPSGSQVILVGAAYVSKEAASEAKEVILHERPRYVLLELDKERLEDLERSLKSGDIYNEKILELPKRKIIAMLFTGTAPLYLMSTTYVLVGALLGAPVGAEFKAALQAASQVGAEVIPGDRDLRTTLQRYQRKTRYLTYKNAGKMHKPGNPLHIENEPRTQARRHLEEEGRLDPVYKTSGPKLSDAIDTTLRRPDSAFKEDWNLDDLTLPGGKKGRPTFTDLDILKKGGCDNADEVGAAFRRIVENGMKGGPIHPMDLLTVRSCGQRVVETYRKKALEEGDLAFRDLEYQALAQVKGVAGLEPSLEAMHQVFGHEQDAILTRRLCKAASGAGGKDVVHMVNAALVPGIRKMKAPADAPEFKREVKEIHSVPCVFGRQPLWQRAGVWLALRKRQASWTFGRRRIPQNSSKRRLWDAASGAEGRDVVGVVGAARVPGIRKMWAQADVPEFKQEVQEYLTLPYTTRGTSSISALCAVAVTVGALGYAVRRFPRAAMVATAAGTAVMLPYIVFGTMALDRWKHFAQRIVETARSVDELGDSSMPDARLQ